MDNPPTTTVAPNQHGILRRVLDELGLVTMYASSRDVKLLCLQRFVRMFAYGLSTLILVAYLDGLGNPKTRIGLFMTLTMVGDICISFFLTLFADALGRRAVLALGALMMTASGVVFALFGEFWVLLVAAMIGVISPSGNEIGPFRAIEESVVAQLTDPSNRNDIFAWYSLLGSLGTACGCMVCGWVIQYLTEVLQWNFTRAYRLIYIVYSVLGLVKLALTLLLSHSTESEKKQLQRAQERDGETRPLLSENSGASHNPKRGLRALLPDISKESIPVIIAICLLWGLDSFASGLAPLSWVTYYFKSRFDIEEGNLGSIFFVAQMLSGLSIIFASSLAKRFGNVNTMVFTNLPSQIFRSLIAVPSNVHLALLFLLLNYSTQTMDIGPRAAFLATIILPAERTAVMGTLNVVKTTAMSLGPVLTGFLVDRNLFWVSFVCSGGLKVLYNLGLLALFKEKEKEKEQAERLKLQEEEEQRRGEAED
ncbi:MFS general substrate transporter [Hypoxylon sp. NC1633]|nr:MFS general substrate transporter [Hypoxylon sp. NC1633]